MCSTVAGFISINDEDYEWVTQQLVKIANTCCQGRYVVSAALPCDWEVRPSCWFQVISLLLLSGSDASPNQSRNAVLSGS